MLKKYAAFLLFSIALTAGCKPLTVIISPQPLDRYSYCEEIFFSGKAIDQADGDITENMVWESSLDGLLGTGTDFTKSSLSPGTHDITLTATNTNGEIGKAAITITIDPPPVVEVTQDIETNTTWEKCTIYVIKAWDCWVNATLEIEPGAIIKFDPDEGPALSVGNAGTILANGTAAHPIVWTTYCDDEWGGDTNSDGSNTAPVSGDWSGVFIQSSGSVFSHCRFSYADTAMEIWDARATLDNCTFAGNDGLTAGALDASDAAAGTIIKNCIFYDNTKPLFINTTFDLNASNSFHDPDNSSRKNTYNGIFLDYPHRFVSRVSWEEKEVPFVVDDNDLWVEETASLTLAPNVIVKFMRDSEIIHYGNIHNHDAQGVYFTSYKDDLHGGDTNADGALSAPADGDWTGMYNNVTSQYDSLPNILYDELH